MRADNRVFLYTDGLTEARRDGELFGEERLVAMLTREEEPSPRAAVDRAVGDVLSFSGEKLADDLAILALRLAGPSVSPR